MSADFFIICYENLVPIAHECGLLDITHSLAIKKNLHCVRHTVSIANKAHYRLKEFSSKAIKNLMLVSLLSFFYIYSHIKVKTYSSFFSLPTFLLLLLNLSFIVLALHKFLPIRSLYVKARKHFNYIYSSF